MADRDGSCCATIRKFHDRATTVFRKPKVWTPVAARCRRAWLTSTLMVEGSGSATQEAREFAQRNLHTPATADGKLSQHTKGAMMNVKKIWEADICRDGGSYGFSFDSDDGRRYEFFLLTRAFDGVSTSHHPPVIYLEDVNSGQIVQRLTWQEAKQFVAPLKYDDARFAELLKIIETEGVRSS